MVAYRTCHVGGIGVRDATVGRHIVTTLFWVRRGILPVNCTNSRSQLTFSILSVGMFLSILWYSPDLASSDFRPFTSEKDFPVMRRNSARTDKYGLTTLVVEKLIARLKKRIRSQRERCRKTIEFVDFTNKYIYVYLSNF